MAPEKPASEYLTADDVAAELKLNINTVRRWLRTGALRGSLLSRQAGWRVTRAELERFLESRQP